MFLPNLKYRSFISLLCVVVLIWNIFGWTTLKVVQEHFHEERSYCTMSFCTCLVEDGAKICTCHHHEMHAKKHSENMAKGGDDHLKDDYSFCHYEIPHSSSNEALAVATFSEIKASMVNGFKYPSDHMLQKLGVLKEIPQMGFSPALLRPPQV